jgi:hypothetical protein
LSYFAGHGPVHFYDAQIGWAVGDNGTILKTSNGGNTWSRQRRETSHWVRFVYFTDYLNGWLVGHNGTILHTSTGEVTPTPKTLVSEPSFSLYPNPTEDFIQQKTDYSLLNTTLFDGLGKSFQAKPSHPNNRLDLSG